MRRVTRTAPEWSRLSARSRLAQASVPCSTQASVRCSATERCALLAAELRAALLVERRHPLRHVLAAEQDCLAGTLTLEASPRPARVNGLTAFCGEGERRTGGEPSCDLAQPSTYSSSGKTCETRPASKASLAESRSQSNARRIARARPTEAATVAGRHRPASARSW